MGAPDRRWFTIRSSTTTSHPLKSARFGEAISSTWFVPASGNSNDSSRADASTSTTTGNGS